MTRPDQGPTARARKPPSPQKGSGWAIGAPAPRRPGAPALGASVARDFGDPLFAARDDHPPAFEAPA